MSDMSRTSRSDRHLNASEGVGEACRDVDAMLRYPDAALQHGLDVQHRSNLLGIRQRLDSERRSTRHDVKTRDAAQGVDDLFCQTLAEIAETLIVAQVRERQHGDRSVRVAIDRPAP